MNIYDEVKVITHEEARKIVKSNHNKFYTEGTFTNDIQNYINQQEKKDERAKKIEELLGLYKHLNKLEHLDELEITAYTLYDINVLKGAIKKREKELEEMK